MTTRHVRHLRVAHILCTLLLNGAHTASHEGPEEVDVATVRREVDRRHAAAIARVQHRVPLANNKRHMCVTYENALASPAAKALS